MGAPLPASHEAGRVGTSLSMPAVIGVGGVGIQLATWLWEIVERVVGRVNEEKVLMMERLGERRSLSWGAMR